MQLCSDEESSKGIDSRRRVLFWLVEFGRVRIFRVSIGKRGTWYYLNKMVCWGVFIFSLFFIFILPSSFFFRLLRSSLTHPTLFFCEFLFYFLFFFYYLWCSITVIVPPYQSAVGIPSLSDNSDINRVIMI